MTYKRKTPYLQFKRASDIGFSITLLILLSPLFLVIALLIKASSQGSLFYTSLRVGLKGKPLACYKFRTMYSDADKRLHHLLEKDPLLKMEWAQYQKLKNDPRIFPLGHFLRKTSLDELPQLINVLLGDLSLIGPRPFYANQVTKYLGDKKEKFLSVKPGITGLWQVSGRNLLTFEERLTLDEHYIDNFCFMQDLLIFFKTFPALFSLKGAY